MDQDTCEKRPQVGPDCSAVGESHPASAGCPSYSGVGNKCLPSVSSETNDNHRREKRTTMTMTPNDDHGPSGSKPIEEMVAQCAPEVRRPVVRVTETTSRGGSSPRGNLSHQDSRGGTSKCVRKRPHSAGSGSLGLSSSEENLSAPKMPTGRRGRGRAVAVVSTARLPVRDGRSSFLPRLNTPAPAECVESDPGHISADQSGGSTTSLLGTNKAEADAAKRAQRQAVAADEVSELARQARERRLARTAAGGDTSTVALSRQLTDGLDVVLKVATKSGNLKGTFIRALKEAVSDIREAFDVLLNRTATEETAKLSRIRSRGPQAAIGRPDGSYLRH